jgi:DNA-binding NtrC family response regulator
MRILLAMAGCRDPFFRFAPDGVELAGPLLALLRSRPFDQLWLMYSPARSATLRAAARVVAREFPSLSVHTVRLDAPPEDNADSTAAPIRKALRRIRKRVNALDARWHTLVNADDSRTELGWHLLAAAAELPGSLLRVQWSAPYPAANIQVIELPAHLFGQAADPLVVRDPLAVYAAGSATALPTLDTQPGKPSLESVVRELGLVGRDRAFREALETAAQVAEHDVPVMILGETGTGKGVVARLIHRLSGRPADRFVAVNCSALPEHLVESILFGHRKGAFTGATTDQAGKFELADGGTLFLDEIGEMPAPIQPKLLKVLEDGLVERLGAEKGRRVRVRVITATHQDLPQAVADKRFREDLYFRLSFARIRIPPLRERRDDIPLIVEHLTARLNWKFRRPRRLSDSAVRRLQELPWKGNIRDLENVIGRSLLMCKSDELGPADLRLEDESPAAHGLPAIGQDFSLEDYLSELRHKLIRRALDLAEGNQSKAALLLGLSPQAIHKYLKSAPAT